MPSQEREVTNLEQLLDRISESAKGRERVSFGQLLEATGRRSFGPLMLLAGLVALSPVIGDIPGVPTLTGVFVLLIALQLVFHRKHFWLPRWLLSRSVAQQRMCKALEWLRKPAHFVDRLLRPRLAVLTGAAAMYAMAVVCTVIAAALPAMEVIPFSANGAGLALTAFGLSLIAHDGLLALLGFAFTALTFGLALYGLL